MANNSVFKVADDGFMTDSVDVLSATYLLLYDFSINAN